MVGIVHVIKQLPIHSTLSTLAVSFRVSRLSCAAIGSRKQVAVTPRGATCDRLRARRCALAATSGVQEQKPEIAEKSTVQLRGPDVPNGGDKGGWGNGEQ
jgi:hypothetical protein